MTQTECHFEPDSVWLSRAPANTMILGEHSVVYGHPALACALNRFIEIEWRLIDEPILCIQSELADYQLTLAELKQQPIETLEHPKLRFVMHALKVFAPFIQHGLEVEIRSEFASTVGLGSSAAVLAATLSGLNALTQQAQPPLTLFNTGLQIIRAIQGRGSGTDLAASLYGGVIFFEPETAERPACITPIQNALHGLSITLLYSGYKTPTAEVLQQVADRWQNEPQWLEALYQLMGQTTHQACQALQQGQLPLFYRLCDAYQGLMDALGVNDRTLSQLIYALRACSGIQASKISGSGLGDCVLGLGLTEGCPSEIQNLLSTYTRLAVDVTPHGAQTERL